MPTSFPPVSPIITVNILLKGRGLGITYITTFEGGVGSGNTCLLLKGRGLTKVLHYYYLPGRGWVRYQRIIICRGENYWWGCLGETNMSV